MHSEGTLESGPGLSEVDPVVFVIDKGVAEKRLKSASKAGSDELPAWKAEQQYSAFCCFIFKNLQFHTYQFTTDFTRTIVKPAPKCHLTSETLL